MSYDDLIFVFYLSSTRRTRDNDMNDTYVFCIVSKRLNFSHFLHGTALILCFCAQTTLQNSNGASNAPNVKCQMVGKFAFFVFFSETVPDRPIITMDH